MEKSPNTAVSTVSQVQRYTEAELALLERFTTQSYTEGQLAAMFPGRTVDGLKSKITKLRRSLGCNETESAPDPSPCALDPDDPGFEDGWYRKHKGDMAFCNSQFVAALQRYAA